MIFQKGELKYRGGRRATDPRISRQDCRVGDGLILTGRSFSRPRQPNRDAKQGGPADLLQPYLTLRTTR